jgi:hypothetical protein
MAVQQRRLFASEGNTDEEIRDDFLRLPPFELEELLRRYEFEYGRNACRYAKRTYARWKSGEVEISEVVVERLRQLQVLIAKEAVPNEFASDAVVPEVSIPSVVTYAMAPAVVVPEKAPDVVVAEEIDLYEQIRKLRETYLQQQHRTVSCSPTSWFRKVQPIVDELVECSKRFEFPVDILEQMNRLASGEAIALNQVLELLETEEARIRTQYLAQEYELIRRWFKAVKHVESFVHTIRIPQGTIEVTVSLPKRSLLQLLGLSKGKDNVGKRAVFISCKNPKCGAQLQTDLTAYEDEPVVDIGDITCPHCRATFSYLAKDLYVVRRVELEQGLRGLYSICYDCPNCDTALYSPLEKAGKPETCSKCNHAFIVPGTEL